MLYNNLPLFSADILDDESMGIELISLVSDPANMTEFIALSKEYDVSLSVVNEEKRIVSGVALIPGQKIIRKDAEGNKFYMEFSKEAIERIAQKFCQDGNASNCNLEHQLEVDGIVYFESYLIDHKRGICPVEFNSLPDGTWCVSAKINNDKVWALVKDGTLKGFSVEGRVELKEEQTIDTLQDLINLLDIK